MLIGLTGKNCAGKGEVAEILKKSGFAFYSLSDVLREEMTAAGLAITRDNLIVFANEFRTTHGPSALADSVLARLDPEKNYVIDSIRNPAEVRALRRRKDFRLLRVEAHAKLRFERMKTRGREGDPITFSDFERIEAAEASNVNPIAQQLDAVAAMADSAVTNNNSLDDLQKQVRQLTRDLASQLSRPDWDEYFMEIAKVVAMRSNCIKRKVAAVIVKDARIISTGYNGTPRGIRNCSDGGCPRCNSFGESGHSLDQCICSHAEENAIVQAAYHGVSIKGATLYSTFSPCLLCTKMIINSGIAEVIYQTAYPLESVSLGLLSDAAVVVRALEVAT